MALCRIELSFYQTRNMASTEFPPPQRRLSSQLEKEQRPSRRFPAPLRKEPGSGLPGAAVGPMFLPYYALQMGWGVLAILTAAPWFGRGGVHKVRLFVRGMALATAGVGWWLEG